MTTPDNTTAPPSFAQDLASKLMAANKSAAPEPAPEPAPGAKVPEVEPAPAPAPEAPAAPEAAAAPTDPVEELEETPGEFDDAAPDGPELPIDAPAEEPEPPELSDDSKPGRAFKALKKELKTVKTDLLTRDEEIRQLKSKVEELTAANPEAATYKTRMEEAERQLGVVKLEASPQYRKAVDEPLQKVVDQVDTLAREYGLDGDALLDALAISDDRSRTAKLVELSDGLGHLEQLELADYGRQVKQIMQKKQELHANQDKVLAEIEMENLRVKEEETRKAASARKEAVKLVIPRMTAKLPSFKDELAAISNDISELDLDARDVHLKAYDAAAGKLIPHILRDRVALLKKIQELEDEISTTRSSSPSIAPSAPSVTGEESVASRIQQRLNNERVTVAR